jgi:hypothetical protein
MNLTPYEYIVCRQGIPSSESAPEVSGPRKSMLVVSEFIGCSPSLSGAIRINPWNVESTAESLNEAISMSERDKELRHEKHYRYVSTHDVAYWSRSFIQDLERACKDHFRKPCWGIGLGFGFRVVALDPNFSKLSFDSIIMSYGRSKSRAIFLDYDGTLVPQASLYQKPSEELVTIINTLCSDKNNIVFIVSGRSKNSLGSMFSSCPILGIAAEHGYFLRYNFLLPLFYILLQISSEVCTLFRHNRNRSLGQLQMQRCQCFLLHRANSNLGYFCSSCVNRKFFICSLSGYYMHQLFVWYSLHEIRASGGRITQCSTKYPSLGSALLIHINFLSLYAHSTIG